MHDRVYQQFENICIDRDRPFSSRNSDFQQSDPDSTIAFEDAYLKVIDGKNIDVLALPEKTTLRFRG